VPENVTEVQKPDASPLYPSGEERLTPARRQKDNDAAVALLEQIKERGGENVTEAERAVLAKYTGNGGNLVSKSGRKGSLKTIGRGEREGGKGGGMSEGGACAEFSRGAAMATLLLAFFAPVATDVSAQALFAPNAHFRMDETAGSWSGAAGDVIDSSGAAWIPEENCGKRLQRHRPVALILSPLGLDTCVLDSGKPGTARMEAALPPWLGPATAAFGRRKSPLIYRRENY
jgi:hypothetical protein